MNHVPLDRAGTDDGHLDDQIVEPLGLHPRQHGHLGAALDLEHPHRIGLRQHLVDRRILGRNVGQVGDAHGVHGLLDGGEHAQRQHIDLHQAQRIDVVLVPLDEGAVLHGGVADRHGLVEAALGQHEAAHMLREMARKAEDLAGQGDGAADLGIVGIQARLADVVVGQAVAPAAPHGVGQGRGDILGKAQRLAHLADGAARSIVDHRGADRRPLAAVALIDVLDHLLAPLVLEIDVDVRRLVALPGDEAGEQHVVVGLGGVHRRHPQAETDHRIGRRAAPLAEDGLPSGPFDDVVHGEEIVGVGQLIDQGQFVDQQPAHLARNPGRIAPGRPRPGQVGEVGHGGLARRHGLIGIFVFQLAEVEPDAARDLQGALHRRRPPGEQPLHLGGGFQAPLGVGFQDEARIADGALLAHAGENVLQGPALGAVIERIVGGDQRRAAPLGQTSRL